MVGYRFSARLPLLLGSGGGRSTRGGSYLAVAGHGMADDLAQQEALGVHAALASIVESSHDAIVGMTSDGVITSWNPAAARLYGYPAKDIIGKPAQLTVPPERRAELGAVLARIMAGEEVERDLTERVCQDGTVVTVSQTISPIIDDTGAVIGAATASRRFSELQEARDRFEVRMAHLRLEAVGAEHRFEELADEVRERAKHAHERFDAEVSHERGQLRDASDKFQARMSASATYTGSPAVNRELEQAHDRFEARVAEQRAEAEDTADCFETQVDYAHDQSQHAQQRFEGLVDKERADAEEASNRFQDRMDAERDKARADKQRLESPAPAGSAPGGPRPTRRRGRPRLQQPARGDPQLRRLRRRGTRRRDPDPSPSRRPAATSARSSGPPSGPPR